MLRRLAAHLAPAGAAADGAGDDAEVAVGAVPGVAHYTDPASGARTLIRTLVANDVTVCFSNPGTSEMHFVAGLDSEPEMRPVLVLQEVRLPCRMRIRCRSAAAPPEPLAPAQQQRASSWPHALWLAPALWQNVATGAADAYARMTGVPASTLL